ncbi:hypothetical protein V6N13_118651 [Hibiscus sabdariffa]
MGRAPCCDKANVKKGPWSPEEDAKLKAYIEQYGTGGNWIALPQKIGLKRCGKSCRLRWLNYLRPNIKHGGFSEEEDNIICSLYISIGSRWSIIAAQLPGRTDNDIKNYWNTKLKKKLLGRRKQSNNIHRFSSSDQDPNDHQTTGSASDDNQFSPGLSNSALERLQLHLQLQGLQNPFSFYNNPALWPKNINPLQDKMIQSMQAAASNENPNLLMQPLLPNPRPATANEQSVDDLYAPTSFKDKELDGGISPFGTGDNLMEPTIAPKGKGNGNNGDVQAVSNFQGELEKFLNNKTAGYPLEEQMADQVLDCFKDMNGSKDSLIWWPTEFDAKSASSNSWDSTSALQSNGVFQDYELVGVAAVAQLETPTPEDLSWRTMCNYTLVSYLHAFLQLCARNKAAIHGKACHARAIRLGLQECTTTSNILINMYCKSGLLSSARKVFDGMPVRSLVSWNTLIGSYAQNEEAHEALNLFKLMQRNGSSFSEFTVSSVLCASVAICAVSVCKQLHGFAIKAAVDSNMFVGTALVDVYAKSGLLKDAGWVFESMRERSVVTWSCMVVGYVQNGLFEEALLLFRRVQIMEVEHDQFLLSSVICGCAGLAALIEGKQVHAIISKAGFGSNIFIASSLIDMYAKCGSVEDAYTVFTGIEEKNVVSWNTMISGFAKHARALEAMISFEKMQQMGLYPNEVTYISVLSACSHMGLVDEAKSYFDLMVRKHNISPNVIHYSCMVDTLGRAGMISEAYDLIQRMPFVATVSMWGSLLACCKFHGNLEIGEVAAKHLFEMEPDNAGNHILLSNIYAANKKWEGVVRARKVLKEKGVKNERGKSWIAIKDRVHAFMVGEINHPRITEIYSKLDKLVEGVKILGYEVETEHDLHDVEESRKQELLKHHSEKLALSFGLLCLPATAPIRIMKNLRICGDCHSFMKHASSITHREIIVRDINRFHHFRQGRCSCGDFWNILEKRQKRREFTVLAIIHPSISRIPNFTFLGISSPQADPFLSYREKIRRRGAASQIGSKLYALRDLFSIFNDMGILFTKLFSSLFGNKEARILVLGLDNAGKTTILYRLQMGEVVSTIPTIGFNVETVQYNNIKFQVWDLGGQTSIRPYWRCYFPNTQAIIYVVDSSDTDRLVIAKEEFHAILEEEELRGAAVLIFANKQDLPGALDDAAITESLELHKIKNRQWAIFKTSAIKGEGLFEGLDWLSNTLKSGSG